MARRRSVSLAAIEQIQTEYLHNPVMSGELVGFLTAIPIYARSLSLYVLGPGAVLREGVEGISERFLEAPEVAEQARGEVRDLVTIARATASRTDTALGRAGRRHQRSANESAIPQGQVDFFVCAARPLRR